MAGKKNNAEPAFERKTSYLWPFCKELRPALDFNAHYGNSYWCDFCAGIRFWEFSIWILAKMFGANQVLDRQGCDYHKFPKECIHKANLKKFVSIAFLSVIK